MTKKLLLSLESALFIFLLCFAIILSVGGNFSYACLEGVKLWFACVLPALFPYLFITAIISALSVTEKFAKTLSPLTNVLFKTGGMTGFAFFISLLSGYPVGAKTVADFKNKGLISNNDAVKASAFCSTSSPMFLIGSVGNVMFNSNKFGLLLFLTHILSAIIVGFIYSFTNKKQEKGNEFCAPLPKNADNILYDSVYSAVISILIVGGLITVFYVLTEVLITLNVLSPLVSLLEKFFNSKELAQSLVFGLFECTRALKVLSTISVNLLSLPIASAICGFGGLSVIIQSVAYLKQAKIKIAPFIFAKIITAILNFIIGLIFSLTLI